MNTNDVGWVRETDGFEELDGLDGCDEMSVIDRKGFWGDSLIRCNIVRFEVYHTMHAKFHSGNILHPSISLLWSNLYVVGYARRSATSLGFL